MNGRAVWLWVLGGMLVVAAVTAGWLATRSPGDGPVTAAPPGPETKDGEGTVAGAGSAPALAPAVAGTSVHPVEAPGPSPGESPPASPVAEASGANVPPGETGSGEGAAAEPQQVAIRDLFNHRDRYDGTAVIVRGRITTLCVRGCRFNLDDGTGLLFVELVDEALERVLPRGSIGRRIEVRGIFRAAPRPSLVVDDPDGVVWK